MNKRLDPRYLPLRGMLIPFCSVKTNVSYRGETWPLMAYREHQKKNVLIKALPVESQSSGIITWNSEDVVTVKMSFSELVTQWASIQVMGLLVENEHKEKNPLPDLVEAKVKGISVRRLRRMRANGAD